MTAMNSSSGKHSYTASRHLKLPPQRLAAKNISKTMLLAKAELPMQGFVCDYQMVSGSVTNYNFRGDTTYYISGTVNLYGTNSFEGNTVIKYTNNVSLNINGLLNCQTGPYRPAILTAKDDNSVGETIPGSTGSPSGYYAATALWYNSPTTPIYLHDIRISYASTAVNVSGSGASLTHTIRHGQIHNANYAVFGAYNNGSTLAVQNVLAYNIGSAVFYNLSSSSATAFNALYCTMDHVSQLFSGSYPFIFLKQVNDSLLVFVTNSTAAYQGGNNGTNNSDATFQVAGAGAFYLATNSIYRNIGLTNIDSTLLAAFGQKTTYPPILYSNVTVSINTTLNPQAQRDTDTPDLGFHYDPIDYLVDQFTITNATLILTNGVAIAGYNDSDLIIEDGSSIVSIGSPLYPNWLVRYSSVQEQPVLLGSSPSSALTVNPYHVSVPPAGQFRFTKFACPAGGGEHLYHYQYNWSYGNLLVQDCEFWSGANLFGGITNSIATLKNNLFARSTFSATPINSTSISYLYVTNNLFWGVSSVAFGLSARAAASTNWCVFNNDFDSCSNITSTTVSITNGNNAYFNSTGYIYPTNATDIFANVALAYKTGPLGTFYQTNTSPLINKGSVTANLVSLYHYTVTTNLVSGLEIKETNSIVDIGYHYVATDANGNPLDTLWFGIPDYLAETNGELAAWEMKYFGHLGVDPNDDPDGDGLNNLQEYLAGSNPLDTMVVAWGDDSDGQCDVPLGLTNVIDVAGGYNFSLALKADSTVIAWGDNTYGETTVPAGLTNVTSIAAGGAHVLALLQNGTVVAWGDDADGQTNVPAGLTNVMAIAAGDACSLALRNDGSVVAWGYNYYGQTNIPPTLERASQIAAGVVQSVAVLTNSTVAMWANFDFSGPPYNWGITNVPVGLSNVVFIAAGALHTLALKADGTVTAWGAGGTNAGLDNDGQSIVPMALSNVIAVAGGYLYSMALQSNGTVVAWGDDDFGETDVPDGLTGVKAISAGGFHGLAIRSGRLTPLILEEPGDQYAPTSGTVTFSSEGEGLAGVTYQWQFNGVNIMGATNASLILTNVQAVNEGSYQVIISNSAGSITSDAATFALILPPQILSVSPVAPSTNWISTNITLSVVVASDADPADFPLSYQWQLNGTNISGATTTNYTISVAGVNAYDMPVFNYNPNQEGNYTLLISNTAGSTNIPWNIRLALPGMAVAWGEGTYGECDRPVTLTNVAALAAGFYCSAAVRDDGSIVQWGGFAPDDFQTPAAPTPVGSPPTNSNIVAVAAGIAHEVALKADGTVIQWGLSGASGLLNFPTNLTGVKAVSAGFERSLALLTNGTIVDWGTFVPIFNLNQRVPSDLTNVTAISCGAYHNLALRSDGTVESWGYNTLFGETNVPAGLSNVMAVAGGGRHSLALKADGTVVAWGDNTYGQCNIPAGLSNVMAIAAGYLHSVALKNDGTVVSWGDNTYGETSVPSALTQIKLIAAGGYHSLAAMFSPTVQYPVDVTKDLLLIYNTNSTNSIALKNYYLAHRPMVANANVLGVACDVGEFTTSNNCDAQIVAPVLNWLTNNPTKHPEYLVLFYDVPTRLTNSPAPYPNYGSISYHLQQSYPGWQPFVNNINAGSAADCEAYVDKLANISTNKSLIISASVGGYGNTNFALDNARHGLGYGYVNGTNYGDGDFTSDGYVISGATNSLIASGVSPTAIIYNDGLDTNGVAGLTAYNAPQITTATNIAGYICWGEHSALGGSYGTNGAVKWSGNSDWWIIETIESFNGQRVPYSWQGNFIQWFSSNAFGGTNYSNTPVGAVSHTEEPSLGGVENSATYFGLWAAGKNFAICAWNSRQTPYFQAIGDPFVSR